MLAGIASGAKRFDAWLDGPADLLSHMTRPRRGATVVANLSLDGTALTLGSPRQASTAVYSLADPTTSPVLARRMSALGRSPLIVEIPAAWIIERRLELPIEAAAHVEGIVASRLGALSPLPINDIFHAHEVIDVNRDTRRLAVVVAILPRIRVAKLLDAFSDGMAQALLLKAPLADGRTITIDPRLRGTRPRHLGAKRALKTGIVICAFLAAVSLGARPLIGASLDERRMELELREAEARRVIADATKPVVTASRPEQVALERKSEAITALGALEDLAAAMPLNAYATEIVFADGRLRISGRTSDLPGMITALESSGRFADSRMVGAALRESDSVLSEFTIETRPLIRTGGSLK